MEKAYRKLVQSLRGTSDHRDVVIVTGPPGSGKSHYVQNTSKHGDVVIDLDKIAASITPAQSIHEDYTHILDMVLNVRECLYDSIENYEGEWETAYIITASPKRDIINELKQRFDATEHHMNTSKEDCLSNILSDESRKGREEYFSNLVDKWFAEYEE